jgi:hypothetical protein
MKHKLKEVHHTNLQEVQQEITRLWVLKMDDSPYKKLVDSMLNRLQKVIARQGSNTHY